MEQHVIVEKVKNGAQKAMYAALGLLLTIAGLLLGIFVMTFDAGQWKAHTENGIQHNSDRVANASLQLEGVIASLQSIVTVDSVQNYQIRQNAETLERVLRELEMHRRASEQ
jgi:hypothetical protein